MAGILDAVDAEVVNESRPIVIDFVGRSGGGKSTLVAHVCDKHAPAVYSPSFGQCATDTVWNLVSSKSGKLRKVRVRCREGYDDGQAHGVVYVCSIADKIGIDELRKAAALFQSESDIESDTGSTRSVPSPSPFPTRGGGTRGKVTAADILRSPAAADRVTRVIALTKVDLIYEAQDTAEDIKGIADSLKTTLFPLDLRVRRNCIDRLKAMINLICDNTLATFKYT
eukprot:CAMPEP_0113876128 /NCGR_PEP_ID=MMETSP0780_2-20120614/5318_1 /TAXON_ID=652834 /ORGANISM="Palpitomonas bilix" /LENGTH=225 /DNA_ID=CAMNT_0000862179 /DNA_START=47 /DNA_END=724 /DNA_ORIENTATION=+ /assembly_acc=CAM_ASM_000599